MGPLTCQSHHQYRLHRRAGRRGVTEVMGLWERQYYRRVNKHSARALTQRYSAAQESELRCTGFAVAPGYQHIRLQNRTPDQVRLRVDTVYPSRHPSCAYYASLAHRASSAIYSVPDNSPLARAAYSTGRLRPVPSALYLFTNLTIRCMYT